MRRRISWLVFITTSTVVASFVIPLCLLVRTLAEDRAMAAADQEAHNAAILVAGVPDSPELADLIANLDARGAPTTDVLTPDGTWLGSNPSPPIDAEVTRAQTGEAFTVQDRTGGRVLLPVVLESGTAVVRSSVTPAELHRGVAAAWLGIISLGVLLLVMALAVASWLGKRVSDPLRKVAAAAHRLREGELTTRARPEGTEETQELARALNGLAERTGELLRAERAVVADLSHRLRTPVTALRLDAEAVTEPDLSGRLQSHIGSLQRTVDAIVKEARRPVQTEMSPVCDATAIAAERLTFWAPLAEDQGRLLVTNLPRDRVLIPLPSTDFADLLDILIDNVFAHTPDGTRFTVTLQEGEYDHCLTVADDGPGPAEHTERAGSTGLGLDIARRMADGCGGSLLTTAPKSGGMQVDVRFPHVSKDVWT